MPKHDQDLIRSVLSRISPTPKERKQFQSTTKEFCRFLDRSLHKAQSTLGGSGAKDTWLANQYDIDIFVCFDYKEYSQKSAQLSSFLAQGLKKAFPKLKIKRLHGSRDYFQLTYKGFSYEVVPILKIKNSSEAVNITDVSPLHAQWVNRNSKKLKDDIRLAKQFFKANRVYGAESYLNGFSGYVVEILVIYYGSFLDLLKQSLLWKEGTVIDPSNHHKKGQATFNLNRSKLNSPLIIIDPVDKNRNASAALSLEKFNHLKDAARKYLKSPHETFFRKEPFDYFSLAEKAKKGKLHLLFLEVKPLSGKDDVVGAKLLKAHHFIEQKLSRYQLKESGWEWVMDSKNNSARFYYLLSLDCLPSEEIRQGPPLDLAEFAADFRRKNKDTFVKDGRLFARIRNQNTLLKDYTSNLIAEPYLKERIKSIVQLKTI